MPTVIRSDARTDAPPRAADPNRAAHPKHASTRSGRGPLASTLRMELSVHEPPAAEPPRAHGPANATADGYAPGAKDVRARGPDHGHGPSYADTHASSPEAQARARTATTPGFSPAFLRTSATENPVRGSDIGADARPSLHQRRPRRPGERTVIVQRRGKSSKRDWVFVVALVAGLGLTASMYLSYRNPASSIVDPSAYAELQYEEDEAPNPFADTTLQPWTGAETAAGDRSASAQDRAAARLPGQESSVSASTVLATELRSVPSGAEVWAGGAVVGNTPVRVARDSAEIEYTIRLPGREPQVVRVGPRSPSTITAALPKLAAAPTTVDPTLPPPNAAEPQR